MDKIKASINISVENMKSIVEAIDTIKTKLPTLISLTSEQRKDIAKMGDKTLPFVEKSLEYAENNPQLVPPYIDVEQFKNNFNAFGQLIEIHRMLMQLKDAILDTATVAGSESYIAALTFYNSVKTASRIDVAGTRPIIDDLSKRFTSKKKKKENTTDSNTMK